MRAWMPKNAGVRSCVISRSALGRKYRPTTVFLSWGALLGLGSGMARPSGRNCGFTPGIQPPRPPLNALCGSLTGWMVKTEPRLGKPGWPSLVVRACVCAVPVWSDAKNT